jgi:hypothetical protein
MQIQSETDTAREIHQQLEFGAHAKKARLVAVYIG